MVGSGHLPPSCRGGGVPVHHDPMHGIVANHENNGNWTIPLHGVMVNWDPPISWLYMPGTIQNCNTLFFYLPVQYSTVRTVCIYLFYVAESAPNHANAPRAACLTPSCSISSPNPCFSSTCRRPSCSTSFPAPCSSNSPAPPCLTFCLAPPSSPSPVSVFLPAAANSYSCPRRRPQRRPPILSEQHLHSCPPRRLPRIRCPRLAI